MRHSVITLQRTATTVATLDIAAAILDVQDSGGIHK